MLLVTFFVEIFYWYFANLIVYSGEYMYKKLSIWMVSGLVVWSMAAQAVVENNSSGATAEKKTVPDKSLNRIAAIVNDEIIAESDLDDAVQAYKQQLQANRAPLPPDEILRKDVLNQMINYRLQLQLAARAGLKPNEDEINNAIIETARAHGATLDELKRQIVVQGGTWDAFRQKIAEQVTINKLQQQAVGAEIKVTDAEVAEYRKKIEADQQKNLVYHLVDFFIPLSEQPTQSQIEKGLNEAREISNQLNSGASLADVPFPYQDLDWQRKTEMPDLFSAQLDQLNTHNASKPLRAPNGFHVLKLIEVKSAAGTPPTDDQLRNYLFRVKLDKELPAWLEKLRSQSYIKIIP